MARKINPKIQQRELPYKLYYFVCEDAESMQCYLNGLKKLYDGKKIVIQKEKSNRGNDAKSVQLSAKNKRKELERIKDSYPNGYMVIACFDKDQNKLKDIKNIISENAKRTDMGTIYNSPCYEYWLLLHTRSVAPQFTNSEKCCKEVMKEINRYYNQNFTDLGKFKNAKNIFDILGNDLPKAIQNAKLLGFNEDNMDGTYTNAHVVFEEIIKVAE
ncbi:MAG: RloB domain-containing protein [Alphaproteobacteria bacterium]|nr:RloB domain-containing protein [Alphaproteobacteria bacterium]